MDARALAVQKDYFEGVKWKLNQDLDCLPSCGGGYCPAFCGKHGFCCSGAEDGNGNCPTSALHDFKQINPFPFGKHYCMNPGKT